MSNERHEIAALFVETGGRYFGLAHVDPWDIERDARKYKGALPVVAHPPCFLWVNLAAVNWKRYQRELPAWYPGGSDGDCFASALAAVRRCGGVLEHPAGSWAWQHFNLTRPTKIGWQRCAVRSDEFVYEVWQSAYGHKARKRTWLLYKGAPPRTTRLVAHSWYSTDRLVRSHKADALKEGGVSYPAHVRSSPHLARGKLPNRHHN